MSWISRIFNVRDFVGAYAPPPGDSEAPTVPGTPAVISLSATSLYVSWGASTDNTAVTEYHIQRSVNGGAYADFLTVTAPSTSFTDTGLTTGVTYGYKARASDAALNLSAYSNAGTGAPTAPAVASDVGVTTRTGAQFDGGENRYDSAGRYIDLMKRSDSFAVEAGTVVFNEFNWIESMSPGAQVSCFIVIDPGPYAYMPHGDYVVKGGQNVTKIPFGSNLSGITSSTSRAYFTINYNPDGTTPVGYWTLVLSLRLRNDTGSTLFNINDVTVCLLSEESRLDAGEVYRPEYLALYENIQVIRTMSANVGLALGGSSTAYLPKTAAGLWTKANARTYNPTGGGSGKYAGGTSFTPYDVLAEMVSGFGCDWHLNLPGVCDYLVFDGFASTDRIHPYVIGGTPYEHGWAEGQAVCIPQTDPAIIDSFAANVGCKVMYVRNPTTYDFQLSLTPGGAILDITRDTGLNAAGAGFSYWFISRFYTKQEILDFYTGIALQIKNSLTNPNVRIWPEMGNELGWNNAYFTGNWCNMVSQFAEYAAGGNGIYDITHSDNNDLLNPNPSNTSRGQAYIQLIVYKAFLTHFPRNRLRFIFCGQFVSPGFSGQGLDLVDPEFILPGRTVSDIIDHWGIGSYYSTTSDPYPGGGTYADGGGSRYWDWWVNNNAWTQNDTWWFNAYQYALQECNNTFTTVKRGQYDYGGIWLAHNPTIQIHDYETNVDMFLNQFAGHIPGLTGDYLLANQRFTALLESQTIKDIHQIHWDNHVSNKVLTFAQFTVLGFYYRFFIGGWGMKNSVNDADTPRSAWYLGGTLPGKPTSIGTEKTVSRAMVSGHSLSSHTGDAFFADLATHMGVSHQYERQIILGSPIRLRVGTSPTWAGFSDGNNVNGDDKNLLTEWTTPTSVTGGQYTDLLITERHDIMNCMRWEETHKYLMVYIEAFMSRSPGAQPYFWTCWHPGENGLWANTVEGWIHYEYKMAHIWSSLAWRINLTAANKGYTWRLKIAPAAYCVAFLVDTAIRSNLAGITQATVQETIDLLFNDPGGNNVHMTTPQGLYYLACLHMAIIHKKSPIGAPTPAGVTAQQASSLQQIAWRSLLDYVNLNEWEPETIGYARKFAYEDGSETYSWRMSPDADAAFFNSTVYGSGNPYVFDAATDTANAGWFTAP